MRHIIALSLLITGIVSSCSSPDEPQSFNFGPGPNDGEDESSPSSQSSQQNPNAKGPRGE